MFYLHRDIEVVAINFQLKVVNRVRLNYDSVAGATSALSTDKQAVTRCFDIVYGYNTTGRHLIVSLYYMVLRV